MKLIALVPFMAFVLSQAPDPLSGGAGWFGAGLLGVVLAWLCLKHLPDKDKQVKDLVQAKDTAVKELVQSKDAAVNDVVKAKDTAIDKVIVAFRDEIALERGSCEKNIERLARSIDGLARKGGRAD